MVSGQRSVKHEVMVCDLISFEHKYMQKRRNEDIVKMTLITTLITALVNLIAAIVKLVAQLLER